MGSGEIFKLVIILFCLVMSAYFSATETAFSTFNRIRMKTLAEDGNKKAALVIKMSEKYDKLLSSVLIGNNIVNILTSSLATTIFITLLAKANHENLATTISTVITTVVVLIFGEITPKTVAKRMPESFALFSAPMLRCIMWIFTPVSFLFQKWQDVVAKLAKKLTKNDEDKGMTEEELISIIEEAEEDGDFDKEESTLIKNSIEFRELEVGDIFTPRRDITAVETTDSKEDIAKVFNESGYSRLPVYEDDIDNIKGILYYKDFYNEVFNTDVAVSDIIKPVIYVAKSQAINDLLKELQAKQLHMAVVMDEFGSTAGIVTMEDILEEIVGEIWDEHDEVVEEITAVNEKEYIVSGKANISKVFDVFDIDEECEAQTVNGWAMEALGKIPEVGDKFEASGLSAEILEMDDKRIKNLRVIDVREDENEDDDKDERHRRGRERDDEAESDAEEEKIN